MIASKSRRPSRFNIVAYARSLLVVVCALVLILALPAPPRLRGETSIAAGQEQNQATNPDQVIHNAIDLIQKNYLHARANPLWNISRDKLLAGKYKNSAEAFQALQNQIPYMEDPELNLLTPDEVAAVQAVALGQKMGLGLADFCLEVQLETGRARVVTPIFGSPAMKAGIQPHDVIVSINGKPTSDMSHEQVMDALRAPAPEGVKLQIERGDRALSVVLRPSPDKVDVLQSEVKHVSRKSIGYIRVALFTPDLVQQAHDAVAKLEQSGVDGYVLDLRNDPGGFLNSAKGIAGLFATGTLGFEIRSNDKKVPVEVKGTPLTTKPLAVLINAGTASASEFLAGGLQGLHRGVLLGERSYGRGQAQIFTFLTDGYGIQIPSVIFQTPDGTSFKGKGIEPDVEVDQPQLPESQLTGPHDAQFLKAVSRLDTGQH